MQAKKAYLGVAAAFVDAITVGTISSLPCRHDHVWASALQAFCIGEPNVSASDRRPQRPYISWGFFQRRR
jgi:hypothetical protein